MADKSFTEVKLSQEQIDNANLIADKANEHGVNADLALAMAWQENKFHTKGKSSAGAVGLLQVMPANAEAYGYKVEDLHDPNINADIGIKILKENLDRFNNPRAALVAYNAGPNTAEKYLAKGEDFDVLHSETKNYLEDIHKIYPLADVPAEAKEVAPQKTTSKYFEPIEPLPEHLAKEEPPVAKDESFASLAARKVKELGAQYPSTAGFASGLLLGELDKFMNESKAAPSAPPPPTGGVPPSSRGNEQQFNWKTKQLWEAAKQGEQNLLDLQRRGIVSQGNPSTGFGPIDITEAGIHIPQGAGAPPPPKTPLEKFINRVTTTGTSLIRKYPRVAGGLSGAFAGHEAGQAKELAEQGDPLGAALSAIQSGLGFAGMMPIDPRVRLGVTGLQLPIGLAKEAWESYKEPSVVKREIKKNPEQYKAKGGKVSFAIPLDLRHVYYHRKRRNG